MIYLDDSGAESTGWVVYGFVEVLVSDWAQALADWLDWRDRLHLKTGIPRRWELHLTKFPNGRGRPTETEWDKVERNRWEVVDDCAGELSRMHRLQFGAVYSTTSARGKAYQKERERTYSALVKMIDDRLTKSGELAIIVMDGAASDGYVRAHRDLRLSTRSIIEDPSFHDSRRNQWVQIADVVAYSAYHFLLQNPSASHTWKWYPTITGGSHPTKI